MDRAQSSLKTDSPWPHQDQRPKNRPNTACGTALPPPSSRESEKRAIATPTTTGREVVVYIRLQCEPRRALRIPDCGLQAPATFEIRNPQFLESR
jgi:hypothetical protein